MPYILSANAGSSSLKLSLFVPTKTLSSPLDHVLTASFTSILSTPVSVAIKPGRFDIRPSEEHTDDIIDHSSAFVKFLTFLERDCEINTKDIAHVCHRVVHGGDYDESVIVDRESYSHIERLSDLAPLHNGAALFVIKICIERLPDAVSIAYFDTTFHQSLPPHISNYLIDPSVARQRGLRKYGFHGISYSYILRAVAEHVKKSPSTLNLILLHLGSGASACAIRAGKSYDTSMGLTPVSGLPGATRSGDIDPSLIFHYTNKAGRMSHDPGMAVDVPVTMAEEILNGKSGWKAMCGLTNLAEVVEKAELDTPDPAVNVYRLAFEIFVDRILNYVGAYFVKLGGEVDGVVFSGGIGENSWKLRKAVGDRIRSLGFQAIDDAANKKASTCVWDVGKGQGKRILVCETDEQFEMARQCMVEGDFLNKRY